MSKVGQKKKKRYKKSKLLKEIREKYYQYDLDRIGDYQRLLINIIRGNHGKIITNREYHFLDERCQEMIEEIEIQGGNPEKYRKRQDKIEDYIDNENQVIIPEKSKERKRLINCILKQRYCEPKIYPISDCDTRFIE